MLLGRVFGAFVAVALTFTIKNSDPIIEAALLVLFITIGVVSGIIFSLFIGPNLDTDRPYKYDSEEFWVDKYGEKLGKDAYKLWLEELDKS